MNRQVLYLAVLIAISVGCGACSTDVVEPPIEDGPVEEVSGTFSWGWEFSALSPCGISESWWVKGPSSFLEEYSRVSAESGLDVYVKIRGIRSERGSWGHMGAYDRQFRVVELVEIRGRTPDDCSEAK